MNSPIIVIAVITGILLSPAISYGDSFDDYMKQEQQEGAQFAEREDQAFNQYMEELQKEFEEYKQIVEEENENYKGRILELWDKPEVSDKKKWVEYSPDYKTKKVIDFEKGHISIDIILDKKEEQTDTDNKLKEVLGDLITEDKKTAFDRNEFLKNVEKRITKKAKHVKTDSVKKEPILATVITGTPEPTKKQIAKAVIDLLKEAVIEKRSAKNKSTQVVVSLNVKLPPKSMLRKARQYKPMVDAYANKRNIEGSLVLAVMQTESAFNPMAKSSVPAFGLMQIVPRSAGKDATEFLFGKPVLLAPSYLYNDENNIKIGTAYLHLLYYKYLKGIENPESRLYCSIAAYNTGPGNVAKAFTGSRNISKAIRVINGMTPKDVYQRLMKRLPYDETKHYLKRVSERIEAYKAL